MIISSQIVLLSRLSIACSAFVQCLSAVCSVFAQCSWAVFFSVRLLFVQCSSAVLSVLVCCSFRNICFTKPFLTFNIFFIKYERSQVTKLEIFSTGGTKFLSYECCANADTSFAFAFADFFFFFLEKKPKYCLLFVHVYGTSTMTRLPILS
jgi:hypothetical protein